MLLLLLLELEFGLLLGLAPLNGRPLTGVVLVVTDAAVVAPLGSRLATRLPVATPSLSVT